MSMCCTTRWRPEHVGQEAWTKALGGHLASGRHGVVSQRGEHVRELLKPLLVVAGPRVDGRRSRCHHHAWQGAEGASSSSSLQWQGVSSPTNMTSHAAAASSRWEARSVCRAASSVGGGGGTGARRLRGLHDVGGKGVEQQGQGLEVVGGSGGL